ncbi:hypothetical protein ABWJ92_20780 [Streptomyces sp. NPDC000609]|uniref:hypothetical protein n=1 Tax=Streptomyces sp. NPDC000609 TaxID=3160957 RepID=UPI0033919DDD
MVGASALPGAVVPVRGARAGEAPDAVVRGRPDVPGPGAGDVVPGVARGALRSCQGAGMADASVRGRRGSRTEVAGRTSPRASGSGAGGPERTAEGLGLSEAAGPVAVRGRGPGVRGRTGPLTFRGTT